MTAEEIRKRYNVSAAALKIYEDQVRMVSEENQTKEKDYDDQDLERIDMIMTLGKMGFPDEEIGIFVRMEKEGEITKGQRLGMLKKQRRHILDEIHQKEKILGELDYLRYELKGGRSDGI